MCQTQSETIGALATALAEAQGELEPAEKNASATVSGQTKRTYADLASVFEVLRNALPKHGLAVTQSLLPSEQGTVRVKTTLLHKSGEWLSSECTMPCDRQGGIQGMGSAITYARRYSISALIGVVSDDDDDGFGAQGKGNNTQNTHSRQAQRQQSTQPTRQQSVRLNFEGISFDLSTINTVAELEDYWPTISVNTDHPEYQKLVALFLNRKKQIVLPSQQPPDEQQQSAPENNPEQHEHMEQDETGSDTMISKMQIKAIQASYSQWNREDRLDDITERLGRVVRSVNDLTCEEASRLLESFNHPESEAAA